MKNLKELRTSMGWTQEVLAEKIGVASEAVSMWETGARTPNLNNAKRIAEAFDVKVEDIFFGNNTND